jgi:hypothetical protein
VCRTFDRTTTLVALPDPAGEGSWAMTPHPSLLADPSMPRQIRREPASQRFALIRSNHWTHEALTMAISFALLEEPDSWQADREVENKGRWKVDYIPPPWPELISAFDIHLVWAATSAQVYASP